MMTWNADNDAERDREIDARIGRHAGTAWFLDDVLVPVGYEPRHRKEATS